MIEKFYIPFILSWLVNSKLLDSLKFNIYTVKLTKSMNIVLSLFFTAIGLQFLAFRSYINVKYNIHYFIIIFISTLFMNMGIKLGFALKKKI